MQVQINGNKKIEFTAHGISYVLDVLQTCPWNKAHPIIMDIMAQLQKQTEEEKKSGPESS